MLWTEEIFGVKKPIIAMLHLDALPGVIRGLKVEAIWMQ